MKTLKVLEILEHLPYCKQVYYILIISCVELMMKNKDDCHVLSGLSRRKKIVPKYFDPYVLPYLSMWDV